MGGLSKTMKRIIVLLLVLCLCAGVPSSYAAGKVEDLGTAEKEAVEILYSLNIIDNDSETFDPSVRITRAQTAKAVYVILKGGQDDGAINFMGKSNTFTDISGHWAEGYINYSFAMGFISGYPNGKFMPDNTITGFEFFKIALSVIGYDAKAEVFEGPRWDQHVVGRAMESGILDGYKGKPNEPITARDAAIILYNTLKAPIVQYSSSGETKKTDRTVGEEIFGLKTYQGILWATNAAGLGMPPLARDIGSWIDVDGDREMDEQNELFNTS
ncbi:MAG: S-layer homology domain-containing protein, partial [Clostridiales bacterium]|nr:S-layer homology domain-containing protein [Clostridiales bacterium]